MIYILITTILIIIFFTNQISDINKKNKKNWLDDLLVNNYKLSIGLLFLIAIYSIILWRLFFLTKSAIDANFYFNGLIILTFALIFFIQTILNIFVNIGVVPTKGLALPFVSYGRSSVIMNFIALAIMLRASWEFRNNIR